MTARRGPSGETTYRRAERSITTVDQHFLTWNRAESLVLYRTSAPAYQMLIAGAFVHWKAIQMEASISAKDWNGTPPDLAEHLGVPLVEGTVQTVNETNNAANDRFVLKRAE